MAKDWCTSLTSVLRDRTILAIGAGALELHGKHQGGTKDFDVAVRASEEEVTGALEQGGLWSHDRKIEHRWTYKSSDTIDILPVDDASLIAGQVTFKKSGLVMNVAGFEFAFRDAKPNVDLPGIVVAGLPAIAVLKMAAYCDRPHARAKDLADLAYLSDHYVTEDEDRLYAGEAADVDLFGEVASAYLLGFDVGRGASSAEQSLAEAFTALLLDPNDTSHRATWSKVATQRRWTEEEVISTVRALNDGRLRAAPP
jgi:predicted nucleotidyltransferase